jgi:hypothetical protein
MVDVSAIAGTVSALKGAMDISKAMVGLHDAKVVDAKVIELNRAILEAQSHALAANDERAALIEQVHDLQKEVADLKAWGAEKQNYELKAVCPGSFAYVPKPSAQSTEPIHWLCPTCYTTAKKSFLQRTGPFSGVSVVKYKCFSCNTEITVPYTVGPGS